MYPDGCALEGAKPGDFGNVVLDPARRGRGAAGRVPSPRGLGGGREGAVTIPRRAGDETVNFQGVERHRSGQARDVPHDPPDEQHRRPQGADDKTVEGVGKLSEAVEWIERARGRLFDFHQLIGRADFVLEEAADLLDEAGHCEVADRLRCEIIGRNVLDGRWTFQVVEEFDELYYGPVRAVEHAIAEDLMGGRRHVLEAELKERRRTPRRPGHESRPPTTGD
jgi:hypothetical protein